MSDVRVYTDAEVGELYCPRCTRLSSSHEPRICWQAVEAEDGVLLLVCPGCVSETDVRRGIELGGGR